MDTVTIARTVEGKLRADGQTRGTLTAYEAAKAELAAMGVPVTIASKTLARNIAASL